MPTPDSFLPLKPVGDTTDRHALGIAIVGERCRALSECRHALEPLRPVSDRIERLEPALQLMLFSHQLHSSFSVATASWSRSPEEYGEWLDEITGTLAS